MSVQQEATTTRSAGPPERLPHPARRAAKHPWAMHYNRLIAGVLLANAAVALVQLRSGAWRVDDGSALAAASDLVLLNLAAAVLVRSEHVINALFWLVCRAPRWLPAGVRWAVSKVYHLGGIHVGGSVAGTVWLVAFTALATATRAQPGAGASTTTLVLAWSLVALLVLIVVCALPPLRTRVHDLFEVTHRFAGWLAVALFWAQTVQLAVSGRGDRTPLAAVAGDWHTWLLGLVTLSIAAPWLRLRRVPVQVERPSSHAVLVRFDHGVTPPWVATTSIARHPLRDWHTFATVRTPGRSGYRLLISRAGDWTGRFIDDPPTHVWVKGVPRASVLQMEELYRRIVYVATGSGIGPLLGQILAARVPARLIWSARSPRATYGDELVDAIEAAQPDALIWDTAERGKPDLLPLTVQACRDTGAEAVVCVSNRAGTWRVVHGVERLGIPAVGPIFDS